TSSYLAQQDSSQKQGTFDLTKSPTVIPTNTPVPTAGVTVNPTQGVSVTVSPEPTKASDNEWYECEVESDLIYYKNSPLAKEIILDIPGYGKIAVVSYSQAPNTYFLSSSTFPIKDRSGLAKKLKEAYNGDFTLLDKADTLSTWLLQSVFYEAPLSGQIWSNPCYITGSSPSLYLYPSATTTITVFPNLPVTYSYPSLNEENTWQLSGVEKSTIRLYYEYNKSKVTLSSNEQGYIIEKEIVEKQIKKLSVQLQLTDKETNDLIIDVRNTLVDIKDDDYRYLKVSIANRSEVDDKLPVTITPKPDTFHRIHLVLTPLKEYATITPPIITPLNRDGFTVMEVGVSIK
ncbi:hypothetical protein HY358_02655, partial [Candidatus Roizmanbacteria bacterium]|nr:hypothetical protein [Candidatus Roizmanbacteria bacterium]